ncbi:MAG: helix-turn-helix transcriptional regulator [Telluria sp.]
MNHAITIAVEGLTNAPSKRFVRNKDVPLEKEIVRERMVSARVMNGLTAVDAAARLGYANSTQLSQIESGERKVPNDWQFLLRMSRVYSVSVDYLLGVSPHPERDPVAAETFAIMRGFEDLLQSQAAAMTTAFVRYGAEREAGKIDLQAIVGAAASVSHALARMRELNPAFDEDMRGSSTLVAAVDRLEATAIPVKDVMRRRALNEQHCLAIAKGEQGPLSSFVADRQLSLGLEA